VPKYEKKADTKAYDTDAVTTFGHLPGLRVEPCIVGDDPNLRIRFWIDGVELLTTSAEAWDEQQRAQAIALFQVAFSKVLADAAADETKPIEIASAKTADKPPEE